MKNYIFTVLLFFHVSYACLSQEVAFTADVNIRNGKVYHKGALFSGELYTYNENAKTDCSCTLKALYTKGRPDGRRTEWYVSGQKKFEGLFVNGKEDGKHIWWNTSGNKERETVYKNSTKLEHKKYYRSGNLKLHELFDEGNPRYFTFIKKYFDAPDMLEEEKNFLENKLHGDYVKNKSDGKKEIISRYKQGVMVSETIYFDDGVTPESTQELNETSMKHLVKWYYADGTVKEEGYLSGSIKDDVWLRYLPGGNRHIEVKYDNGKVVHEGLYYNDMKSGQWVYHMEDGDTQEVKTFKNDTVVSSVRFKTAHLVKNVRARSSIEELLNFTYIDGTTKLIALETDGSEQGGSDQQTVLHEIKKQLRSRLLGVYINEEVNNSVLNLKIKVGGLNIVYEESIYTKRDGSKEKGYDAFILFTLDLLDADDHILSTEKYKVNKSDKLLSSLFNTVASTYAKTTRAAFLSTKKHIDISGFLMKHFPIPADLETRKTKRKRKKRN